MKDVIVYRARRIEPVVQREIDRLACELPDVRTFAVCYQPDYESAKDSISGKVYCYGQRDLHGLPYPAKLCEIDWSNPGRRSPSESTDKKFVRNMEFGHQDLPVLKFFLEHPEFDRYWVIEDDVRCSGPWSDIFTELGRSNADLLMTAVQGYWENPGWHWWNYIVTGDVQLPLKHRLKGFLPFCRLSAACLRAIDQKYREENWGGHYEMTWANIARVSGLSIEDVGGQGSFAPPERRGRIYSCTLGAGHLFPGTFVFRPPFHDTGISEFGKNLSPTTLLWHPVKFGAPDLCLPAGANPGAEDDEAEIPNTDEPTRAVAKRKKKATAPLLNVALRKPALQSSVSRWSIGRTPTEDAKGGNNGYISGRFGFHTEVERNPWWQVDLQDSFRIHQVVLFNRSDEAHRLNRFTILGSQDGTKWKELFQKTDDRVFGRTGDPFTAELPGSLYRFVRVRLDGEAPLHFSECQVFGEHPDAKVHARMLEAVVNASRDRSYMPKGRFGRIVEIGGFAVFVDDENYNANIVSSLERGDYERAERQLVEQVVTHVDRVIDVGTSIGLVAMTAARIAGPDAVATFEANADIASDARDNFRRNGMTGIHSHVGALQNRQSINDSREATFHLHKAFWSSRTNAPAWDSNFIKKMQVPAVCLEDTIKGHGATVLICDVGGSEAELLTCADLTGIRMIIMDTHYDQVTQAATDEMMRQLIASGFSLHLGMSQMRVAVLHRK